MVSNRDEVQNRSLTQYHLLALTQTAEHEEKAGGLSNLQGPLKALAGTWEPPCPVASRF